MKLKLRASVSPLFTGRLRSFSESFSVKSKFPFSNGDGSNDWCHAGFKYFVNSQRRLRHSSTLDKFQLQSSSWELPSSFSRYGVEKFYNLKRSLHSSSGEEEDFSELGQPLLQGGGTLLKTRTEKPNAILQSDPFGRAAAGMSLPGKNILSTTDASLKQGNHTPTLHLNFENDTGVSRTKSDGGNAPNFKNSCSIVVENVPSGISLIQLKEAVSFFGEIVNTSMRVVKNGFTSCHIEFKSEESRNGAVAIGWIALKGFILPVRSLLVPDNITVRISNISMETPDPTIHSSCMACGPLEGLMRTTEDAVNVFFNVKDSSTTQSILKKLNDVFIDNCQWSAELLPTNTMHTLKANATGAQSGVEPQVSGLLDDLRKQLQMRRIYVEDLEELHHALVHLRDYPPTFQKTN